MSRKLKCFQTEKELHKSSSFSQLRLTIFSLFFTSFHSSLPALPAKKTAFETIRVKPEADISSSKKRKRENIN